MTPVRLEPAALRSRVKHSTTEPLRSHFGDVSVAQLVASMSGLVLGDVDKVMGSNLARDVIFTASICSVDSLYLFVFIYSVNLDL